MYTVYISYNIAQFVILHCFHSVKEAILIQYDYKKCETLEQLLFSALVQSKEKNATTNVVNMDDEKACLIYFVTINKSNS